MISNFSLFRIMFRHVLCLKISNIIIHILGFKLWKSHYTYASSLFFNFESNKRISFEIEGSMYWPVDDITEITKRFHPKLSYDTFIVVFCSILKIKIWKITFFLVVLRGVSAKNYGIKMHPKKLLMQLRSNRVASRKSERIRRVQIPRHFNTYKKYLVLQIIPSKIKMWRNFMKFLKSFEIYSNNSYKSISYASNLVTFKCIKF